MIFSIDRKEPEAPALIAPDRVYTYGKLHQICEELKGALSPRSLVFCFCANTPEAVAGYLGALHAGAVPLLLDAKLGEEQKERLLQTYQPAYLWMPVGEGEAKVPCCAANQVYSLENYALFATGYTQNTGVHEQLGMLLATSGSTGSPKLVRLSLENIESNAASICEYLQIDETERPITTLPMQYTYGLSVINSHLLAGACVLMTKSSYVQQEFWDFLEAQKATSFSGVPYTYRILKRLRVFRKEIPSLRYITQAGGRLPEDLQQEVGEWAERNDIRFYVMYGQTEATARMSYLPPEMCLKKIGSIGIAIPGGAFHLADEEGKPLEDADTVGELVYTGPNVSLGYAQSREDLLLGDENRGVLHTGDLARRDADGYYYIAGRKKRFIKMFGIRVNMDECERILKNKYPDTDLACGGTDDHLKIYLTKPELEEEAPAYLAETLKLNFRGFEGVFISEIPRNASGKILYKQLG